MLLLSGLFRFTCRLLCYMREDEILDRVSWSLLPEFNSPAAQESQDYDRLQNELISLTRCLINPSTFPKYACDTTKIGAFHVKQKSTIKLSPDENLKQNLNFNLGCCCQVPRVHHICCLMLSAFNCRIFGNHRL